ncbi:Ubiquitin thioesterase OTU1like [Caligus rogercresseyi]|uniref:Ubiquitin thioesterase OTU1like n=1 Tax=Caligus rogercresseyi TaxID=217165 RepID=A0A7T8GSJ4_CALRO|nr:Ubiquitin thioesterase OTU1like [Caligus rogercresseyi]
MIHSTSGSDKRIERFSLLRKAKYLSAPKAFVEKEKSAKKFTDVGNFSLKCEDCGTRLVGQKDAQAHAKATGHARFGEV